MTDFNMSGVLIPVPTDRSATSSLEAAALARLWSYLHRAPDRTAAEELIARDAFMSGFKAGCRFSIEAMTVMSSPDVRRAFLILGDIYGKEGSE